jgi:NADH dehydrogenase (ubiquinone) Fe-S protein 6
MLSRVSVASSIRSSVTTMNGGVGIRSSGATAAVTANTAQRCFATGPPPATPSKAPYNIDPSSVDKTAEEMRIHTRTYEESEFKLGKHRSNALELIEKFPVIEVDKEMAICDGGAGPLGHPLEYISLERPGVIERCKYCGLRFASKAWAKH